MPSPASPPPAQVWKPRAPRLALVPQLRERVLDRTAAWLAARGVRRIALYGQGRHSRAIIRQPWLFHGITVVAVLDDQPTAARLVGVPVMLPAEARDGGAGQIDAVVVSSTEYEDRIADRAAEVFGGTGVEIVRLYTPDDSVWDTEPTIERLVAHGLDRTDADWLVHNRAERHDAMLPIIPPARTELHLRRYELAASVAIERGASVAADLACGTGYGCDLLAAVAGLSRVTGVDIDPDAVRYAARYHHAGGRASFRCADATDTGLGPASVDLVASFETIEHVRDTDGLLAEFDRVLRPGGTLVISTPNQLGPTPYHVHDFGFTEFASALRSRFKIVEWFGQLPRDEVYAGDLPPGVWRLSAHDAERDLWPGGGGRPDFLLAVCRKPDREASASPTAPSPTTTRTVHTPFGAVRLARPVPAGPGSTPTPDDAPIWRWLGTLGPQDVLWDASDADPVPSIAAGARCGAVLLLRPEPADHWAVSESVRHTGLPTAGSLGVALAGQGAGRGPFAPPKTIAAIADRPLPTHLRLNRFGPGTAAMLAAIPVLRSVCFEEPPAGTAEIEALRAAGFAPGSGDTQRTGEGPSGTLAVFDRAG